MSKHWTKLLEPLDLRHAEWLDRAACKGMPGRTFFKERWASDGETYREALAVCAACPVRQACLDYAISHHEIHGVWGGTTPHERRSLIRGYRARRAS